MAYNAFLKMDGITDPNGDLASLEVLSFNTGVNASGNLGTGRGAGRSQFLDIIVVKHVDQASSTLLSFAEEGKHIQNAALYILPAVQTPGTSAAPFLKYSFSDLFIDSIRYTGNEHGDVIPLEEVSFHYQKLELAFSVQNPT